MVSYLAICHNEGSTRLFTPTRIVNRNRYTAKVKFKRCLTDDGGSSGQDAIVLKSFFPYNYATGSDHLLLRHVGRAELVDEPLRTRRLLYDAFLVVLSDRPRQLVVVHRRPILPLPPQFRHANRVLDFEDS